MKRLFLLLVLSSSIAKADDFMATMKYINSFRVTSGVKAAAFGLLGVYAAWHAVHHSQNAADIWSKFDTNNKWKETKRLGWEGVGAFAGGFAAYELLWNYMRPNLKHALSIK